MDEQSKLLTPQEFADAMRAIESRNQGDPEGTHVQADDLMATTLRAPGYGEGVDIFDNMARWYA